jgi:hypothetical protein
VCRHFQGYSSSEGCTPNDTRATRIDDARHPSRISGQRFTQQGVKPLRHNEVWKSRSLRGKQPLVRCQAAQEHNGNIILHY